MESRPVYAGDCPNGRTYIGMVLFEEEALKRFEKTGKIRLVDYISFLTEELHANKPILDKFSLMSKEEQSAYLNAKKQEARQKELLVEPT